MTVLTDPAPWAFEPCPRCGRPLALDTHELTCPCFDHRIRIAVAWICDDCDLIVAVVGLFTTWEDSISARQRVLDERAADYFSDSCPGLDSMATILAMGQRRRVTLELRPHEGVPPVRFGMTREEAREALAELGAAKPFARGRRDPMGWMVSEGDLILFVYCDEAGLVEAVELARPGLSGEPSYVQVTLQGLDVFGTPALELLTTLQERGIRATDGEDYYPTAPDLALGFSRAGDDHGHVAPDNLPAYFESVLVGAPGYYDEG